MNLAVSHSETLIIRIFYVVIVTFDRVFLNFDLRWTPSSSVANSNQDSPASEACFPLQKWTFLNSSEVLDAVLEAG